MTTLNNICRACLKSVVEGYNIYDIYDGELTLSMILNTFVTMKVHEDDGFPQILCEMCAEVLIQFYNFLTVYEASTKTLSDLNLFPSLSNSNELNNKCDHVDSDGTFKCTICDLQFINNDLLENHILKLHYKESNNLSLNDKEVCTKGDTMNLTSKKIHSKRKKKGKHIYICDICGKKCHKEFDLKDHMDTHSDEKKYNCNICCKKMKSRSSLARHLKGHSHSYQLMCEICGKKFTHPSSLRTHHKLLHVREKTFHCLICDHTFSLKSTLQKHITRHRQHDTECERKFTCTHCNMKYFDKSSLIRHVDIKHKNQSIFNCLLCHNNFNSKSTLLRHQKTIHIDKVKYI